MLPPLSATSPWGPTPYGSQREVFVAGLSGYDLNTPVAGSNRPSVLSACPVYQTDPSGATAGSCGRDPGVGSAHSVMTASTSPGTRTPGGLGLPGKLCAR